MQLYYVLDNKKYEMAAGTLCKLCSSDKEPVKGGPET